MIRGRTIGGGSPPGSLLHRLRERGVVRVAASYAVISWLLLQIASVVFDPLGVPTWVMTALVIAAAVGFPLAIGLAWFLELGENGITVDTAPEGAPRPATRGVRHYADIIVIGVLVIAVVVLLVRQSNIGKPKPPENPAIAVLPFENLSGDPGQEYFSDGLAEETLDRLGRVPGLRVIARSSSFTFKGSKLDARVIAEKLGVTTILEGSVRRDGKRLKLSARLIDGATGQQAWSGSFDREMTDVFEVQAQLAAAIVTAIAPAARGGAAQATRPPTTDLNAYDLYLLAKAQLAIQTPESQRKALDLMDQAIAVDPDFASAHAQRAAALLYLRNFGTAEESAEWSRQAEASVHRALAIDGGLSEAHEAYATLLRESERPGAEEEYKRAVELNPSNASAWHNYAVLLANTGRREEARRATERVLELNPRYPPAWANYVGGLLAPGDRRYKDAVARAIQMIGDIPDALNFVGIATTQFGYPVETMQVALAKRRLKVPEVAGAWIFEYRAWLPVDVDRAAAALPIVDAASSRDFPKMIRLYSAIEVAGLKSDWAALDRLFGELRALLGDNDPSVRLTMAFWLALQGRYADAAQSFALAQPVPELGPPPRLGGDTLIGLIEPAELRIYRGTGLEQEARHRAHELLALLRAERPAAASTCEWLGWMRYAGIAANEGLKSEAVDALRNAMRCSDLPFGFRPQLPWFKSLEGYRPYDELVLERERRVDRIRAELIALDPSGGSPGPPAD
ncbi:MAG: tetratricopeptide repeat protein [Steroidobacteraceae bacterium]